MCSYPRQTLARMGWQMGGGRKECRIKKERGRKGERKGEKGGHKRREGWRGMQ